MKKARKSPSKSTFEPEIQIIMAVYLQAKYDLGSKVASQREQARLFFEADGWDVSKIEPGWKNGRKTTSRPA